MDGMPAASRSFSGRSWLANKKVFSLLEFSFMPEILIKEALMSKMKDNLLEIAVNLVVILSVISAVLKVSL